MSVSINLSNSFELGHNVVENGHARNLTTRIPREVLFVSVFSDLEAICLCSSSARVQRSTEWSREEQGWIVECRHWPLNRQRQLALPVSSRISSHLAATAEDQAPCTLVSILDSTWHFCHFYGISCLKLYLPSYEDYLTVSSFHALLGICISSSVTSYL